MSTPSTADADADIERLMGTWTGPFGGLPPFQSATPHAIEEALRRAIDAKRQEVQAISTNPEPPTFANTVQALEAAGVALQRVLPIYKAMSNGRNTGDMPKVVERMTPLIAQLDDEVAHDDRLYIRIDEVKDHSAALLSAEDRRLIEVWHRRLLRLGSGLEPALKVRLSQINIRLAALSAAFQHNLQCDDEAGAVFIERMEDLDGLPDESRRRAAAAAAAKGRPGIWAISNERGAVWPVLIHATLRSLREKVWRMWTDRGDHAGPHDNKPLITEILALRGEKARILGFPTFAHYAMADRMVSDPVSVVELLLATWRRVVDATRLQIDDYQAIADRESPGLRLAPWDRQFFAEKLRRERFGLDSEKVREHLALDSVLAAMFWAAGRTYALNFDLVSDAPVLDPSCRVYSVSRAGQPVGVLYLDLFNRHGKSHGAYQMEYRVREDFRGRVLPISSVNLSLPVPLPGEPVLLPWAYANVLFHEFGHALHMLCSEAPYASLGSASVAWDFVELPALLNERWLIEGDVLGKFARHFRSGEPMPKSLIEPIEAGLKYDRIFSLNLDYLLPAIVDLRLHLLADGGGAPIDAIEVERDTMDELGMPEAWDLIMRVTQSVHSFVGAYAAGVYVYLWADVLAADAAESFLRAPGGFYDATTGSSWLTNVLSVGHTVPADDAFRAFAGHDPTPLPLQRRFGLAETSE